MLPQEILKFPISGMRFSALWGPNQSGFIAVIKLKSIFCFGVKKNNYADNIDTDPENRSTRLTSQTVSEASNLTD